jgi:hypothetical protein
MAGLGGETGAFVYQLNSGDPLGQGLPLDARGPDERHAVGHREVCSVEGVAELRVALGDPEEVEVDRDDLVGCPAQ